MSLITPPARTTWGGFIEPNAELRNVDDVAAASEITIHSGYRASFESFRGQNFLFDRIAERIRDTPVRCEDQCSAQHYADLFEVVRTNLGRINRVVEVGVFMGGSASIFAGCVEPMELSLNLVDVNPRFLRFAYERIRRTFPGAAARVRLFYGDLPTYVHEVLRHESGAQALIHHDGAHDFNQVVKDLSALSFVKEKIRGLAIQDTHLRGRIRHFNFVDAAVYAVFGFDAVLQPLGTAYPEGHPTLEPNAYEGNYFLANAAEGAYLPFESNSFRYPHPSMTLEEFLPERD